jgi:ankyrin repeat protein
MAEALSFAGFKRVENAAVNGDVATLRKFYEKDPRYLGRQQSGTGASALHYAMANGQLEAVEYLVEVQSDALSSQAHLTGALPVHWAAMRGQLCVLRFLLDRDPTLLLSLTSDGETVFHQAVYAGHEGVILFLHTELPRATFWHPDNSGNTVAHAAALGGNEFVVRLIHELASNMYDEENGAGYTPRELAVTYGSDAVADFLALSYTALLHAINEDRLAAVRRILLSGHNPNCSALRLNVWHTMYSLAVARDPLKRAAMVECIENALPPWSPEAHRLFYSHGHRLAVIQVLLIQRRFQRDSAPWHLPKELYLRILAHLPRMWGFMDGMHWSDQEAPEDVETNRQARVGFLALAAARGGA